MNTTVTVAREATRWLARTSHPKPGAVRLNCCAEHVQIGTLGLALQLEAKKSDDHVFQPELLVHFFLVPTNKAYAQDRYFS